MRESRSLLTASLLLFGCQGYRGYMVPILADLHHRRPGTSTRTNACVFDVYIEDTDCYDIMFYANYPVILERSLIRETKSFRGRVASIKTMQYKESARLGDRLMVSNSFTDSLLESECHSIDITKSKVSRLSYDGEESTLYLAKQISFVKEDSLIFASNPPIWYLHDLPMLKSNFHVWSDELDMPNNGGNDSLLLLPTRTIFALFERARTDLLGGPAGLNKIRGEREVKSEDPPSNIVVSRVSDYKLNRVRFDSSLLPDAMGLRVSVLTQPHQLGESLCDFHQQITLCLSDQRGVVDEQWAGMKGQRISSDELVKEDRIVLASASVTCSVVDVISGGYGLMPQYLRTALTMEPP